MRFLAIPSLRWRLVTIMCLAYIVVAAVTEVVSYRVQSDNLQRQLATRARSDAIILAAGAVAPLRTRSPADLITLEAIVNSLMKASESASYAAVYGTNGCRMAATPPARPPRCLRTLPALQPQSRSLNNGDEEGTAPISDSLNQLGLAQVILPGGSVQRDLRNALLSDLLLRGVGLIIFLMLTLAIARYILGPLGTMTRAADLIRRGRLDTRVPRGDHTELTTVADAFNDMAGALEERIRHLSFLSSAAPRLPSLFRDGGDVLPTLREFCSQLETGGAGLLPLDDPEGQSIWYDGDGTPAEWRTMVEPLARQASAPQAEMHDGWAVMVVPLLGDAVFITARAGERPFSREEQQVVTNFAYQLGVAADNARLFASQQEALQVKDQFLSIVSHELRTPLTTIKGYSQMLRRKLADDPDGSRFAVNIETQVSRLGRLVDDLLDVTRYSRTQFELKRQRIDLRPLLDDTVTRFGIVSPGHSFELQLDEGNFEGLWDRDRLEQVMNNLVGNAIKYSPPGGTVVICTRHYGNEIIVGVRDQGLGIAEDEQQRLFERFFRGSAEGGNVKGLGLGLYVTRRIVEAHGGTVGVKSVLGEGSEFTFTLPLAPAAVSAAPQ